MTAQAGDTTSFKAALRRTLRARRAQIRPADRRRAATAAARRAARLPAFRRARRIGVYLEHGSELATAPLIELCRRAGKRVFVPVTQRDGGMRFVALAPRAPLRRGAFGIRKPVGRTRQIGVRALDLLLMPLVGFDAAGRRLGAGGGYFDRLLAQLRDSRRPLRLGYAYAQQQVDALPADPWDVGLHAVITESAFLQCPR